MKENEISKSNKIKIILITAIIFIVSIAGISYAYFTIQITGNDTASSMRLRTANMSLVYNDVQIVSGDIAIPGWSDTKTLTVTNNGNVSTDYTLSWREIENTIINDELVISATCASSSGTCNNIPETAVVTAATQLNNVYVYGPVSIAPGVTHTYTLTAEFKETGSNQNYNQDKYFYGTLNIADGTPTESRLFGYESVSKGNDIRITYYLGSNATYDVDEKACETYIESWNDEEWDSKTIEEFCHGDGVDPYDKETLGFWLANSWIDPKEYENFGIDNVRFTGTDVIIPEEIDGNRVVAIGHSAFSDKHITSVVLPSSVSTIDEYAFYNNELSSIVFPNGVDSIGDFAFYYNNLTSVTIPNKVSVMSESAFAENELISIKIPEGVEEIGYGTFSYNQLTSVNLPDGLVSICPYAFAYNEITSITIPGSVGSIGEAAFLNNKLSYLYIPNNVVSIANMAFNNNRLSDSQATIYKRADKNLDGIAEIVTSTVISYGGANKDIAIPDQVTVIDQNAYAYNELTSVILPKDLKSINAGAFNYNLLSRVTIPSGVTSIGNMAFYNNNLLSVTIEGKKNSGDFRTYGNNLWGWNSVVTCIKDNTSMVKNGCINWNNLIIIKDEVKEVDPSEIIKTDLKP